MNLKGATRYIVDRREYAAGLRRAYGCEVIAFEVDDLGQAQYLVDGVVCSSKEEALTEALAAWERRRYRDFYKCLLTEESIK